MADLSSLLGAAGVGGAIGKAIVSLELDTAKYQAEMKTAQASTVANTNSMSSGVGKYAGFAKAAFLGVGVAAVAGVAVAVSAASDLNEQINKTKVVFEGSADAVLRFSETSAEGLGIAQAEALKAAGEFGQLFDAAGLATSAAADMSQKMVTLGADLGSFNNIPVAEALEKIRGGLSGEAEPLRQLGVFLSEARVEAEAFSSGIAKAGTELTDAQKIQARYNIILEDTTKAQGDFGRTVGESLPNQMKVLKAGLIDSAAAIGKQLLPAMLDLVTAFKDMLPIIDLVLGALADIITLAAEAVSVLAKVLTLNFAELDSGIEHHAAVAQRLFDQYDRGVISIIELENKLVQLRDETGLQTDVTAEYSRALATAYDNQRRGTQAALEWKQIMEAQKKATGESTQAIVKFAHMTGEELEEWSATTKESFKSYVINLDKVQEETDFTRKDLRDSFRAMLEHARDLNQAMRTLSREHWINDDFVKFLAEQPDKLILFADSNEAQQRRMQTQWEKSGEILNNQINQRLDVMTGVLDKLDKGETKHTVIISYRYEGFDPSKPGMSGSAQQR